MKDQELFKQLHNLSKMTPDVQWKEAQRSIMLSQINAGDLKMNKGLSFWSLLRLSIEYMGSFSQPVVATFLVAFLFLTGGFAGLRAAQDTKPGDSLYLAKIVGEKTQIALAMTDKKKAQLGLGFAVRRVEEMKQLIAEEKEEGSKDEEVEQLVEDFKKEIRAARLRIKKISETNSVNDNSEAPKESSTVNNEDFEDNQTEDEPVDTNVFSAMSSKSDDGLQISSKNNNETDTVSKVIPRAVNSNDKEIAPTSKATTTREAEVSTTTKELLIVEKTSLESILKQASGLLQSESYDTIFDVLDDAGDAVDQNFDTGEVQGVEESVIVDEPEVDVDGGEEKSTEPAK